MFFFSQGPLSIWDEHLESSFWKIASYWIADHYPLGDRRLDPDQFGAVCGKFREEHSCSGMGYFGETTRSEVVRRPIKGKVN
ncbi:UNVERIFIED_CONTAM: hypothetical protein Sradi_6925700 [Sesamum radiatum]|uniref:Uncharacterized protein n=1 Tax=Sesamum radiatum TaxID=300843 RepID=A0AAW2JG32_SESRA